MTDEMAAFREVTVVGLAALALVGGAFCAGRWTAPADIRTIEVVKEKVVTQWVEKKQTASANVSSAAKTENVRVVTRWLRADRSVAKEQVRETGSTTTEASTSASVASTSSQGKTDRSSERLTVAEPVPRARFHVNGFLGLNAQDGLRRVYGVSAGWRMTGPVWVSAIAFPQMRLYGAGVGLAW